MNYYEGKIITIDSVGTEVKDDAFSVERTEDGGFVLHVYIADPITFNEAVINSITKDYKDASNETRRSFVRLYLRNKTLTETKEKRVFDFCFKIDKNGKVVSFDFKKNKIMVDLEMDYDDIFEEIDQNENSELSNYFEMLYFLGELLYSNRNNGEEFETYDDAFGYNLPFPREFNSLVNLFVAKKLDTEGIPFIYDVKETNRAYGKSIAYYTSKREINELYKDVYGAFTSPMQNYEDMKNLEILNKFYFSYFFSEKERKEEIEKYRKQLEGYFEMKPEIGIPERNKKNK